MNILIEIIIMSETEIGYNGACRPQRCRDRSKFTRHPIHSYKQRTFNQFGCVLRLDDISF